jgi:hypothetical protein
VNAATGGILDPASLRVAAAPAAFADGMVAKAKGAVDPDCTIAKAAKGAATKATVGVGNRCGIAETARDTAGVDGKGKGKAKPANGPVKKLTDGSSN